MNPDTDDVLGLAVGEGQLISFSSERGLVVKTGNRGVGSEGEFEIVRALVVIRIGIEEGRCS